MGNNRPSQTKRRKDRARRERLLLQANLQQQATGVVNKITHEELVRKFLRVPVNLREEIFGSSFCKDCLQTILKRQCTKCFSKNTKIKKLIQVSIPRVDARESSKSNSITVLKKKLKKIRKTFCDDHLESQPKSGLCVACLEKQYKLTDALSQQVDAQRIIK